MLNYESVQEHITRLVIPFHDIFTTVYVIRVGDQAVLFDTATYTSDADHYILPLLQELGITADMLRYIVISHDHGDHAGGLSRMMQEFPHCCIVSRSDKLRETFCDRTFLCPEDGDILLDTLQVVTIPGHAPDCLAVLDTRTGTLISGDCLQLWGIFGSGEWGSNIRLPAEYLEALEKVRRMEIQRIYAAHDYHPYGYKAIGSEAISLLLDACRAPVLKLRDLVLAHPELEDPELQTLYNTSDAIPVIRLGVVTSMRAALAQGRSIQ